MSFIRFFMLKNNRFHSGFISVLVGLFSLAKLYAADYTVEQWRVAEIPLTSLVTYANPFQNVDVTATFTGPGGEVITRPAFWDGGVNWKKIFSGPPDGAPYLIALNPRAPERVFLVWRDSSLEQYGLYGSRDGGATCPC